MSRRWACAGAALRASGSPPVRRASAISSATSSRTRGSARHHLGQVGLGGEPLPQRGDVPGEHRAQRALEPPLDSGRDRPVRPDADQGHDGQGQERPGPGGQAQRPVYETGHGLASQISAAYSAIVRSLENLPERGDVQDRLARPRRPGRAYSCAQPSVGFQVRPQVGQVHVMVAAASAAPSRSGSKTPGSLRLKWSEKIRSSAGPGLRLVARSATTGCTSRGCRRPARRSARRGRSSPRPPPRPSRSWRRRACRSSARRSS